MKLINSSVKILDQDWSLKGIFRAVEEAGRTCYKSVGTRYFRLENEPKNDTMERLITEAKNDPNLVVKIGQNFDNAIYISIPNKFMKNYPWLESYTEETYDTGAMYENLTADDFVEMIRNNGHGAMLEHGTVYLKAKYNVFTSDGWWESIGPKYQKNKYSEVVVNNTFGDASTIYITTNLRVIVENNWIDDLKYLCEPTEYHKQRVSVRFVCDRGVSHELVRHNLFCVA